MLLGTSPALLLIGDFSCSHRMWDSGSSAAEHINYITFRTESPTQGNIIIPCYTEFKKESHLSTNNHCPLVPDCGCHVTTCLKYLPILPSLLWWTYSQTGSQNKPFLPSLWTGLLLSQQWNMPPVWWFLQLFFWDIQLFWYHLANQGGDPRTPWDIVLVCWGLLALLYQERHSNGGPCWV